MKQYYVAIKNIITNEVCVTSGRYTIELMQLLFPAECINSLIHADSIKFKQKELNQIND